MDIKTDTLEIDDITYTFIEGDFFKAEMIARRLLSFADGIIDFRLTEDGEPDFNLNLGAVLGNLKGKDYDVARNFIFDNMRVKNKDGGIPFASHDERNNHLGKNRSHYTQLILEGAKFHFADFLPSGEAFLKSTIGQAINRALATQK